MGNNFSVVIAKDKTEYDLGKLKHNLLRKTKSKWTLVLDEDEKMSEALRLEIKKVIRSKKYDAYYIPFQNHFLGRPIRYGGEDYRQLRLFKKEAVIIGSALIHEKFELKKGKKAGYLKGKILHYSYRSIPQIFSKFTDYAVRQAKQKIRGGEKTTLRKLFLNPIHMFWARFIEDKGYKDGLFRIPLDLGFAYMEFLTYFVMLFVKKMKINRITIDGGDFIPGSTVKSGIQRIISSFLKEAPDVKYYHFGKGGLPKRFFSELYLPLTVLKDKASVFLGFSGKIPFLLQFSEVKKIVFLYDLGFVKYPKFYSNPQKLLRQTQKAVKYANKIVVLSDYSKVQLIKKFPKSKDKIVKIYPGIDHLPRKNSFRGGFGKYFLYVGVVKPIKNIVQLFKQLNIPRYRNFKLLILGQKERKYFSKLVQTKEYLRVKDRVIFLNRVSDYDLYNYYTNAQAVLNFSYEEGFCFPIAEALSLKKKIITNNHPIYKELKTQFKVNQNVFTWKNFTNKLLQI